MPPRAKYTKEQILNAAYELMRERGVEAIVAREVGRQLNISPSPIFTFWKGMDELRADVLECAKNRFRAYFDNIFDYHPTFKEFGLRWMKFAIEEPNIYRFLFLTKRDDSAPYANFKRDFADMITPLCAQICQCFSLKSEEAEALLEKMILFGSGIAAFAITDPDSFSIQKAGRDISQVCISLVLFMRLMRGDIPEIEFLQNLASTAQNGIIPIMKTSDTEA